jgi:hypothetical protein
MDGPTDASIPAGWDAGIRGWDDGPFHDFRNENGCNVTFNVRHVLGPRRWGPVVNVGPRLVIAWYMGDCTWELRLIQQATQQEFQLYEELLIQTVRCGQVVTETQLAVLNGPTWRAVRRRNFYALDKVIDRIQARDASGLPCGDEVSLQGVPQQVLDAVAQRAKENEAQPGQSIPVTIPRREPDGPIMKAAPSPEEAIRREREKAEIDALLGREPAEKEGEHTHEEPGRQEREQEELLRRLRRDLELERAFERWLREREREREREF